MENRFLSPVDGTFGFSKRCLNTSRWHIFLPRRERVMACLLNRTRIAGLVGGRFSSELAGLGRAGSCLILIYVLI